LPAPVLIASTAAWLAPAYGVAAILALEVAYLFLRRALPRFQLRLLYHLWALGVGAVAALVAAGLPAPLEAVWKAVAAAAVLLTAIVLFGVLEAAILVRPWDARRGPYMPKLARDAMRALLVVVVVLVAARTILDQPIETVLVSSTAFLAVVGLALQDVLKNAFAGMALQMEKPFQAGDWLLVDGVPAQVVDMTWRSTHLRTNEGWDIFEPNATMASGRLTNYGSGRNPIGLNFEVGLPYATPPAQARQALEAAVRGAPGVAAAPPSEVFVMSFGESAVNYRVRAWTQQVAQLSRFHDSVHGRIWYQLQRDGITIPFPIRTIEMHDRDRRHAAEAAADRRRVAELLARLPLFHDLQPEALERLAAAARRLDFDQRELLVREGETGDSLFVVARGQVLVSKSGALLGTTSAIELAHLGPGDFFGEMSLLTGEPRSATVTAEGPCQVIVLEREAVAPVLAADPSIAEALSRRLAARVAETEAKLESRRGQTRPAEAAVQVSLLARIRTFFKLVE
jgi:small-conductance mechanosensitive channel/CRP-like cAMP-binding protein